MMTTSWRGPHIGGVVKLSLNAVGTWFRRPLFVIKKRGRNVGDILLFRGVEINNL